MENFADRLIDLVEMRGNPCVLGLDPRIDDMPNFATSIISKHGLSERTIYECVTRFHFPILDAAADLIPAVKLQIAFYEQYGLGGLRALQDTAQYAKKRGLIVIVDAKCSDISSTAEAYARALLGRTPVLGGETEFLGADCITVTPYLGEDSLEPFVKHCTELGKGLFVLVKTSNAGSRDLQDLPVISGVPLYTVVAKMIRRLSQQVIGTRGYSAIGAVVGATFSSEAAVIRSLLPESIFLVPGYGAQGATGLDTVPCFRPDGLGALITASRSLTYGLPTRNLSEEALYSLVQERIGAMVKDVSSAVHQAKSQGDRSPTSNSHTSVAQQEDMESPGLLS